MYTMIGHPLLSTKPFNGRKLTAENVQEIILSCLENMSAGSFTGLDAWLLKKIMFSGLGYSETVQAAIDHFDGEQSDKLLLHALQLIYGYGAAENPKEAFRTVCEAVFMGDKSGRCHTVAGGCLQWGFGTEKNLEKAVEMYKEGVRRGCADAAYQLACCYVDGSGVTKDRAESIRLYKIAHFGGFTTATCALALCYVTGAGQQTNVPLGVLLYMESAARGQLKSIEALKAIHRDDPEATVPFSCWAPSRHLHHWVPDEIHQQMMVWLMLQKRRESAIPQLPKRVIYNVCFFLCCRPRQQIMEKAAEREYAEGQVLPDAVSHKLDGILKRMDDSDARVDQLLKSLIILQQQMATLMMRVHQDGRFPVDEDSQAPPKKKAM